MGPDPGADRASPDRTSSWGRREQDRDDAESRGRCRARRFHRAILPREDRRPSRVAVSFNGVTDPGKVRGRNEDHFLVARLAKTMEICATSLPSDGQTPFSEEEGYLIVVADGMGGAAAGERATRLAVESVEAFVQNTLKWFLHLGGREERVLFDELRRASSGPTGRSSSELGATPRSTAWGPPSRWRTASPRPLCRPRRRLACLSLPRRPARPGHHGSHHRPALVDAGMISAEEARHHHRRHVVTNVLGGPSEGVYAEIHKLEIRDGDVLVFCSDGLTKPVPDADIAGSLPSEPIPRTPPGPCSSSPSTAAGPTTSPSSSPGTGSIGEVPRADDPAQSPAARPWTFSKKSRNCFLRPRADLRRKSLEPIGPDESVFPNLTHTVDRG